MLIKRYYDVSVSRCGIRRDFVSNKRWGAQFKVDADTRELFPYINRQISQAQYTVQPLCIRFMIDGIACTLYPKEAIASSFEGEDHAYAFIKDLVIFLNDLNQKKDRIEPDYRIYEKPLSVLEIVKMLPRTNCRECGYSTCTAFAARLSQGKTLPDKCPGFAAPISIKAVYPVLGPKGVVESTIAVEIDGTTDQKIEGKRPKPGEATDAQCQTAATGKPLLDNHGVRIQKQLTKREIEVLRLVADGASNPEISTRMGISHHTVKSHVLHIFNKINANGRTEAAVWAVRNNII